MKFFFTSALLASLSLPLFAQESDKQDDSQKQQTKIEQFLSRNGVITKSEDFNTADIPLIYGSTAQARVRKITSGGIVKLFYQIEAEGKYGTQIGSVALEDFVELRKAISSLKDQLPQDAGSPANYLENRYITDDGLRVGYYFEKKKPVWFVRLSRYGSGNTLFLKSIEGLEESLAIANDMFEKLK